ncbi:hypothetical protein [Nocardia pseudovaccinii]|uniref:hypothetical protein n=1 Tax=Nocardia pseudovaccinii TaxID=189540 RepID=UPI0007A55E0F|nr:hypothetical protein [Nocardia pseudovaccinii]
MAAVDKLDNIETVTTRLREYDLVLLDQAIARWKMEIGSRKIDVGIALNAAVLMILRADNEELVREYAASKGYSEDKVGQMITAHKFFMDEFFDVLEDVVETRKRLDGRIKTNKKIA